MTAKVPENIIEYAIKLYAEGKPLREVAGIVGRNEETLRNHFKKRGVQMRKTSQGRPAPNAIMDLPEIEIIRAYEMGRSENSLAMHFGISRNVIRRILNKHNIHVRNQSESEKLKWSQMTDEQRENQVIKAHAACSGRVRTPDELKKMAISREENFPEYFIGIGEPELKEWFKSKDIKFEYQKACLSYNLDFVVNGIDLELTGRIGRNQPSNTAVYERAERVYQQGYKTLYVEFVGVDRLIENANLVLSTIQEINANAYGEAYYILLRIFENHHSITVLS